MVKNADRYWPRAIIRLVTRQGLLIIAANALLVNYRKAALNTGWRLSPYSLVGNDGYRPKTAGWLVFYKEDAQPKG